MTKIKVSELFYSLQGEGYHVGVPSVFLRTFGCNFTCGGFGMPAGEKSTERDTIAFAHNNTPYADYKDLPLVHTGCDSYASWDPRFKGLSPVLTIPAIVDEMQRLLPKGRFGRDKHLIITGGEPLLGWQKAYPALFDEIRERDMGLEHITFETNGTQELSDEFMEILSDEALSRGLTVTFSISAKLPNSSGEKWKDAIKPDVVAKYTDVPFSICYFKFVVSEQADIDEVNRAVQAYKDAEVDIPVYLMPVGGTNQTYELNERNVADFCRDNGYRFSPRIQVPLYKNAWGT
jgi:organic radical activating enzyme